MAIAPRLSPTGGAFSGDTAASWRGAVLILALCSVHAKGEAETELLFRDLDPRLPDLVQAVTGLLATPVAGETDSGAGAGAGVAGRAIFLPRDPTAGCDAVLEDAAEIIDGDETAAWVAVVLPRCPSRLVLDLIQAYRPSHVWPGRPRWLDEDARYPEMAGIVCAHPVWNASEPNGTWPIPVVILVDGASTAKVAAIHVQRWNATKTNTTTAFNSSATVTITTPKYEPNASKRAVTKTVVFVAFGIMSFCIMMMYCRIRVGTMPMDTRSQLWSFALAEASQRYSAEEVQLRRQLTTVLIGSMPTRVIGATDSSVDKENPGPDKKITATASAEDSDDENTDCCVICLDPYADGDQLRQMPCKHEFHVKCIDPWLLANHNCPLCKYNILGKDTPTVDDPPLRLLDETEMSDMAALPASRPEGVVLATAGARRSSASLGSVEPSEDAELLPPESPKAGEQAGEALGGRFGFGFGFRHPDAPKDDEYLAVGSTATSGALTATVGQASPTACPPVQPGPWHDGAVRICDSSTRR